ncbi:MAG TPA: hypothetical protein VMT10_14135 [Solirubrobacteraceae bacterium]|nr:hypothetical protein [Solirubrobacteraceae bacterium]
MGLVDRNTRLFDQIVRLRRAEREHPENADIVAVRADLERQLGDVLTRSMAARLLGVHHSSLQRWVSSGDLPLVMAADGRKGIPVSAVATLSEQLRDRQQPNRSHRIEPVVAEDRRRADMLNAESLVGSGGPPEDPHSRAARRSLAYHRAIARRLRRAMVDQARHQIWQWERESRIDPRYASQWEEILKLPVREVSRALGEDTPYMADLRQSSPFAGMLSEAERRKILQDVR